jgi:cation diffusion facilitator CzcD-associated flavoprotein CzcO
MVCNGHHWSKRYPKYDGQFSGESFHSKDYKSPEQLRGKRVLVVGAGNSAFDISSECARVSKAAFLSVRRGIWIFPKTFMGKPLSSFQIKVLPNWIKERLAKIMLKLAVGSAEEYGLPKPTISIFDRHPTINTDTLINIKNGKIKVKPGVKKLFNNEVEFEDGTKEHVDTIVYATGFHVDFPFLPPALKRVEESVVKVVGI